MYVFVGVYVHMIIYLNNHVIYPMYVHMIMYHDLCIHVRVLKYAHICVSLLCFCKRGLFTCPHSTSTINDVSKHKTKKDGAVQRQTAFRKGLGNICL